MSFLIVICAMLAVLWVGCLIIAFLPGDIDPTGLLPEADEDAS